MSKCGKLEAEVEIKASPEQFFEMYCVRPHHVSKASVDIVQACNLHDGEFGKQGSIISWNYVHDGKSKIAKEILDIIDHEKKSISFKVIEGELIDDYKNFKLTFVATPKGEGSLVHWTFEYENLHTGIGHPKTFIQLIVDLTKDKCVHIRSEA